VNWGVSGLVVRFGRITALDGVTLGISSGRVTAVVGGDGAGKSTLLRVVAGTLAADAGQVQRPARRDIGYLPANSGTYPDLSVEENLAFSAAAYGVPATEARARAGQYLDRMGLTGTGRRLAGNLSGGMRQKLGVVRAMLHRPGLLVLDEPTTGIDPVSRADVWWLVARAAADGAAVLLSTTYVDEAERAAEVLLLDAGRVLAAGSPAEIVRAVPGEIRVVPGRPAGAADRAWRRGAAWRVWQPAPGPDTPGERVAPDLNDAVVVAALRRELTGAAAGARR
jgi:ABC-2 type transport system ATP-binding protein